MHGEERGVDTIQEPRCEAVWTSGHKEMVAVRAEKDGGGLERSRVGQTWRSVNQRAGVGDGSVRHHS